MITLRKLPLYFVGVLMAFFMMSRGIAVADSNLLAAPKSTVVSVASTTVEPAGSNIPSTTPFSYSQTTDSDISEVTKQTTIINEALSAYSPKFLNQTGLKGVLLVKNLNWGGQHQVALPDVYESGYLIISIDDEFVTAQNGKYITYVVHHELGHFIQHALNERGRNDNDWKACGSKDSQYGEGGLQFNGQGNDAWTVHPATGFITSYATASIAEDQAEVQAHLQTDPDGLYKLAESDKVLSCKVKVLADRLAVLNN